MFPVADPDIVRIVISHICLLTDLWEIEECAHSWFVYVLPTTM